MFAIANALPAAAASLPTGIPMPAGGTTRQALLQGRMVIDMGIYPPQLVKYPRIGALEVTYQLTDQGKPIGQKLAFSKLEGHFPAAGGRRVKKCTKTG